MKIALTALGLLFFVNINSQTWQWALGSNENGHGAYGRAVDTDASRNVYLAAGAASPLPVTRNLT